jgi:hypothetical protein
MIAAASEPLHQHQPTSQLFASCDDRAAFGIVGQMLDRSNCARGDPVAERARQSRVEPDLIDARFGNISRAPTRKGLCRRQTKESAHEFVVGNAHAGSGEHCDLVGQISTRGDVPVNCSSMSV